MRRQTSRTNLSNSGFPEGREIRGEIKFPLDDMRKLNRASPPVER